MTATMPINAQAKAATTAAAQKPDPDAHLSDHEWRMKMAAEGKAYYLPGRSIEEVKAEIEASRKSGPSRSRKLGKKEVKMTVSIPDEMLAALQTAASEIPYLLSNAAAVFGMLAKQTALGFAPTESELCGLYELCKRGLEGVADKEGVTLDNLDCLIRQAQRDQKDALQPQA